MITIRGRVVARDGDKPIVGAMVFATPPRDVSAKHLPLRKPGHALSDEDGRFAITGCEPGAWMVFVQGGGWVSVGLAEAKSGTWNPFVAKHEQEHVEPLELLVEPTAGLSVRVVDAEDNPVPRLDVSVRGIELWAFRSRKPDVFKRLTNGQTDENGLVRFDQLTPHVETEIVVRRASHPIESHGLVVLDSGEKREVAICLPSLRWIDVRVTDSESGKPVAGAALKVLVMKKSRDGSSSGVWVDTEAITDGSGRTRLTVVPGRPCQVAAVAAGYLQPWNSGIPLDEITDETSLVELALTPSRSISGCVVVPKGVRANDVALELKFDDRIKLRTRAKKDGTFHIGNLRAGTYDLAVEVIVDGRIFAAAESVSTGRDDVTLELNASDTDPSSLKRMIVSVLGPNGQPVTSCKLMLTGLTTGPTHSYPPWKLKGGVLPLDVLAGELWLDVFHVEEGRLGSTQVGPMTPQARFEVRLEESRSIAGRVLGPDGRGVHGAVVKAESPYPHHEHGMKEHARMFTDEGGHFELKGVSKMTYVLTCEPPLEFLVTNPMRTAGGTSDTVIRLEPSPAIVVTLVDSDGIPVAGARLRVQYCDFRVPLASRRRQLSNTVSDENGKIHLCGLDPRRLVFLDIEPPEGRVDLLPIHRENWQLASGEIRFG